MSQKPAYNNCLIDPSVDLYVQASTGMDQTDTRFTLSVPMAEFVEAKCYEGRLNEFFQQIASLKKHHLQAVITRKLHCQRS